jgi:ketosteroid isomerase-like protein
MKYAGKGKAILALVLIAIILLALGCGGNSASAAAEDFVRAVADKDCQKIVDLIADDSKAFFEQEGQDAVAGCEASIGAEFADQEIVIKSFEVTGESDDGDTHSVDFKMESTVNGEDQSTEDTVKLVKQNGSWKVTLF